MSRELHVMGWYTVNSCRGRIDAMCEDDACDIEVCVNSLCGHIDAPCKDDASPLEETRRG